MPGQTWTSPEPISCAADPLVELADGKHQPVFLAQEGGDVGQLDGVVRGAEQPEQAVEHCVHA